MAQQLSNLVDKATENFKDMKDKITVPSTLDPQKFEGNVKLTGHSFFDSLVIAIATIIIGLPAVNWFYSIPFKDKVPTIQCFPPASINESATGNDSSAVSKADIESLCLYRHTLYANFFPILVTFFGFWIAVLYFVWRNYNSSKFNLFVSLVNEMALTKNEQTGKYSIKNFVIANRLTKIFSKDNYIYYTYLMAKCLQALFSLAAFLVTVFLYVYAANHSAFFSAFSDAYNVPMFYCNLEQFEFLNSSFNMQVPCVEFASLTTALILLIDFVLLFVAFVFTILSIFQIHTKELQYRRAAQFSFHTGMSLCHYYNSKWFDFKPVSCDLDFLIILLRRTDSGLADTLWEVRTLDEIDLLNKDDLMRSDLNYSRQMLNPIFRAPIEFSEAEDLKWNLSTSLTETRTIEFTEEQITIVVPNSFRAVVLGYAAFATRNNALYISFDSTSLGIPLALSRVFNREVFILTFDPYFTKDGDKPYCIKEWHSIRQLILSDTILSSETIDVTEVNKGIEEADIKDINFIVLGPIEDKTSRRTMLTKIFRKLSKPRAPKLSESGCLMLVITPAESNFFRFTLQDSWNVNVSLSDGENLIWPPSPIEQTLSHRARRNEMTEPLHTPPNNSKIDTPDGSFTFDLYQCPAV